MGLGMQNPRNTKHVSRHTSTQRCRGKAARSLIVINHSSQLVSYRFHKKAPFVPGVMVHTFNPSTWEAEIGDFCEFKTSQSGLHIEFQASQSYIVITCLQENQINKQKNPQNNKNACVWGKAVLMQNSSHLGVESGCFPSSWLTEEGFPLLVTWYLDYHRLQGEIVSCLAPSCFFFFLLLFFLSTGRRQRDSLLPR